MTLEWIWLNCELLLWWLSDWSLNVDIHSIFSYYVRNYRNTRHYLYNWVLWCILYCNSIASRMYQNFWYISINYWIAVAAMYIKSCINCQYFHCQTYITFYLSLYFFSTPIIRIFVEFFSVKNMILEAHFLLLTHFEKINTFWKLQILNHFIL